MDVSIVIVNWNTRAITRNCLSSVFEQTKGVDYEVVVVDNASSDDSVSMIKSEFPQVCLIENPVNKGFAAANNQGISISSGRYVLLLNSDTIVLDGAIQKSIDYADENLEVGVVGCRAFWLDGRKQNTCFRFHTLWLTMVASLLFFRETKIFNRPLFHPDRYLPFDFDLEHDVDAVAGCFFLVRREVIEDVGVLDEDFFMYGEEAEWCHRIAKEGWLVRYFPGAEIIHIFGASSSQIEEETKVSKKRGFLLFIHKTSGSFNAWLANLIMVFGVLLRIPFWFLEDIMSFMVGHKFIKLWNKRSKLVLFHFAGLFYPVWKR